MWGGEPTAPPSARLGVAGRGSGVAGLIDHTLLAPEATRANIEVLCAEAVQYGFAAVCVNGGWVSTCAGILAGSGVKVATVAGFPLGATTSEAKACEVREVVVAGADEIDMVAAVGRILDAEWRYVRLDIEAAVQAAADRPVKVILETAVLTPSLIRRAAKVAAAAGAAFVKTSTGFHPAGGATPWAVKLLKEAVGADVGVKAAGGIRDCAGLLRMIAAGADRIGTSSAVPIVQCVGAESLEKLLGDPDGHLAGCKTTPRRTAPGARG